MLSRAKSERKMLSLGEGD